MTAVLDRATEAAAAAPVPPTPPRPAEPGRPAPSLALAEAALIGVSLATIGGYARLFANAGWFLPIAVAAVLGHVIAIALRRLGVGPLLSTVAHLALLPVVLTWLRYGGTTGWLLPTSRTIDRLADDLSGAWDIFLDISAPVPAAPGFVIVAMAAAWIVAAVSDGLAFRLHATVEALAPATGLFLFSTILADDRHRVVSAIVFVAAVLLFTLAARVARTDEAGRWLATDAGRGARSLLVVGGLLAVGAVLVAALVGPRLPGGDGEAVFDLDGGGGGGDRVTLSPLVDIRSRLIEQSDIEAFRVEAALPAYWRTTSLDDFDGNLWSSSGAFVEADGRLPSTPADVPGSARLNQRFRIANLAQIWLPAAYEPVSVDSPDAEVDWDADSSTLVVSTERETSDGVEYEVFSIVPRLLPGDLAGGTSGLDREFLDRFTRLPAEIQPLASRYAEEAVGGAATPYDQALALQDWFRTEFTYSLEVVPGHGTDALAAFLDPSGRVGYCEQFAGAYAALARSLGMPARVAVGFTPGDPVPDDPTTYIVRGRNAHAWPELYFAGVGWVGFEPTPGRGAPGAEGYTNVAAQQAEAEDAVTPTTVPGPVTTFTLPQRPAALDDPLPEAFESSAADEGIGVVDGVLFGVVAILVVWLAGVPLVGALRRSRRRRAARGHPELEVAGAWSDSVRALALVDLAPRPAETPREFAHRAAGDAGTDRAAHEGLAEMATSATYGGTTATADVARARRSAGVIIGRARRLAGPWRRLRGAVSPRHQFGDG